MAEMMRLQIVTPDEAFFDGEGSMVELNTADGEAGIYPKHIPMVVAVAPGVLKIHGADGVKKAALLSGFLQERACLRRKCMKDFFEDKEKRIPGNMEYDIEQIRNERGKGMNIEKIAENLNLDQAYVEFLFWFGIL